MSIFLPVCTFIKEGTATVYHAILDERRPRPTNKGKIESDSPIPFVKWYHGCRWNFSQPVHQVAAHNISVASVCKLDVVSINWARHTPASAFSF